MALLRSTVPSSATVRIVALDFSICDDPVRSGDATCIRGPGSLEVRR